MINATRAQRKKRRRRRRRRRKRKRRRRRMEGGVFLFQWQLMTERCWRADRKGMGGFYEGQKGGEGEGMLPKTRTLLMR